MDKILSNKKWSFGDPLDGMHSELEIALGRLKGDNGWTVPTCYATRNDTERLAYAMLYYLAFGEYTKARLTQILRARVGKDLTLEAIDLAESVLRCMRCLEDQTI